MNRSIGRAGRARRLIGTVAVGLGIVLGTALLAADQASAQTEGQSEGQAGPVGGAVPGEALGATSDSEFWRAIRQGRQGTVSIPDSQAGVMIQSEGDNWRAIRNGPVTVYGAWLTLGIIALLALFFALRGRIRLEAGPSGRTIERFNGIDRFTHWLTATSFIVLALTGLNLLYGQYILMPILGQEIFSDITLWGKYAHNFLAFAFMIGVIMMLVLWVADNIPNRYDLTWVAKGGGMFTKHTHPPAKKFNAGQKIVFWVVILGGISISLSGIALLFPFEIPMFGKTFEFLNIFGLGLPADISPTGEMQLAQVWHGIVGLILTAIIIAHIYIGTIGMEGAFDAMGSGHVDENWAREHHNVWVAEMRDEHPSEVRPQPAE